MNSKTNSKIIDKKVIFLIFSVIMIQIMAGCRLFHKGDSDDDDEKPVDKKEMKSDVDMDKSLKLFTDECENSTNEEEIKVFSRLKFEGENCLQMGKRIFALKKIDLSINSATTLRLAEDQKISTAMPLRHLSEVETLMLQGNSISDIDPLKALPNLKDLDLRGNPVTKLVPISSLEKLDISNTKVDSLEPVKKMENIKDVYITGLNIQEKEIQDIKSVHKDISILDLKKEEIDGCAAHDKRGFNQSGLHRNGTRFDDEGYDKDGYDKSGFNRKFRHKNGTRYDENGYNAMGFNKKGFNKEGDHENGTKLDKNGYDSNGFDHRGFTKNKTHKNGTEFDDEGYDIDGYNSKGFNSTGHFRDGSLTDASGYDHEGYDRRGFDRNKVHRNGSSRDNAGYDYDGYDENNFDSSGIHKDTNTEFGPDQLTQSRSRFGANHLTQEGREYYQGYDYQGFNELGFSREGVHRDGGNRDGAGYDARGFLANGTHRNGTQYDSNHQNMAGLTQAEAEEQEIGKACYIPGPGDYMGRTDLRGFKHYPAGVVNVGAESLDIRQYANKDELITAIHNQCKSYNAKVRSNRGESVTRTRVRLFNTIKQNLIAQIHLGVNPYGNTHMLSGIRRDQIVAEYLKTITGGNMNKSTNVSFQGETGIDAGGLRKELFRVVIDKLKEAQIFKKLSAESKVWELNPAYNQFDFCTRNDQARNKQNCFENVGKIVAKILIVEKDYIEIEFSNYLLQRLLDNAPRTLVDLFSISKLDDEDFFKGLTQGLGIDDASWLGLDFDGLIPNGDATDVSNDNVYLYTHLKLKNSLIKARKEVTDYFLAGFHSVLSGGILQLSGTNANELELILRGIPEIKADDIQPLAQSSGYASQRDTRRIIGWFWEIVREIEATDPNFVPQLMIFWTSSRTIPTDIDRNSMKISVQNGRSTGRLPSSHTCFNTIDLSVYPSKQAMKRKLEQAVRLSQGFDE